MTRFGALLGAICAAIVLAAAPLLRSTELLLLDAFTRRIAATEPADSRIVIVAVNEKSVSNLAHAGYGRPPYPRDVWAQAIAELQRAGAKVIAIDIGFYEEDLDHPEADRKFTEAVRKAPVVLAVNTDPKFPRDPNAYGLWQVDGCPAGYGVKMPFTKAQAIGTVRLGETARSYPTVDWRVPSLALESARMFLDAQRSGRCAEKEFVFSNRRIPTRDGAFSIRWHSSPLSIDFDKLLIAALAREDPSAGVKNLDQFEAQFRGKIVLIGYTAQGLFDLRETPLGPKTPGLLIHANAIDDIINARFNRELNSWVFVLFVLLVVALLGGVLQRIDSQWLSAAIALAAVAVIFGVGYVALRNGIIVRTITASAAIALTYVTITVVKVTTEQRRTAQLRATFGRYVSPQILEHILSHPESVQLGGERRDLTIMFSDIRGFTTISEASEPEEVVEMLNEYLTRMVDILLAHGGTLDKFIGDAVMGFWNAPADDPDHPRHAVECALEMIDETARLREKWSAEGKAAIRIGIGINTGDAVAGNIGAEQVFGYTVIGDAVNLASRLEGKNKDYGTEIIISEFTLARIGDAFETVYLDEVKVKGKERAVRIYQVKGRAHA